MRATGRATVNVAELRSRVARTTLATELASRPNRPVDPDDDLFAAAGEQPPLPADPELAPLLGGGLRRGGIYTLSGSTTVLFRLLAAPTEEGLWCGLVGLPDLGYEAAAQCGVALDRLVVVPGPGGRWLSVTATLLDALALVVVRPPAAPTPAVAARLAARLRHQGSTLVVLTGRQSPGQSPGQSTGQSPGRAPGQAQVQGRWPRVMASITVERQRWHGLGAGHGYLQRQEIAVSVTDRCGARRTGLLTGALTR